MKDKSRFFAQVKGTHDRYRWMMFKYVFRKLRRSGKTWHDVADILALGLAFGEDLRHDLLNHYFVGTKVPSSEQLLKILNALNQTKYTSPAVVKFIKHLTEYQIRAQDTFNKEDMDDFNRDIKKIESERMKAIKKASKDLRTPLKTLVYYSSTSAELNGLIELMIKEIHVELDSEIDEIP